MGAVIDNPMRPLSAICCKPVTVLGNIELGARRTYSSSNPTCCTPMPSPIIRITFFTFFDSNAGAFSVVAIGLLSEQAIINVEHAATAISIMLVVKSFIVSLCSLVLNYELYALGFNKKVF
ncbi:MAG: hypothetical protein ACJA1X_001690 [Bermanella sp.]|jgi:hypothetical protein